MNLVDSISNNSNGIGVAQVGKESRKKVRSDLKAIILRKGKNV